MLHNTTFPLHPDFLVSHQLQGVSPVDANIQGLPLYSASGYSSPRSTVNHSEIVEAQCQWSGDAANQTVQERQSYHEKLAKPAFATAAFAESLKTTDCNRDRWQPRWSRKQLGLNDLPRKRKRSLADIGLVWRWLHGTVYDFLYKDEVSMIRTGINKVTNSITRKIRIVDEREQLSHRELKKISRTVGRLLADNDGQKNFTDLFNKYQHNIKTLFDLNGLLNQILEAHENELNEEDGNR